MQLKGRLSRIAHDLGWSAEQMLLAHVMGQAIDDLLDPRPDCGYADSDHYTVGYWRRDAVLYFRGNFCSDCESLNVDPDLFIDLCGIRPALKRMETIMNLETRVAHAVAANDKAALQQLADEGYLLNRAPAGARVAKTAKSLEITDKGVQYEVQREVAFSPVDTPHGRVYVAIDGVEVHVWQEG